LINEELQIVNGYLFEFFNVAGVGCLEVKNLDKIMVDIHIEKEGLQLFIQSGRFFLLLKHLN
jgi:hypothetical protein